MRCHVVWEGWVGVIVVNRGLPLPDCQELVSSHSHKYTLTRRCTWEMAASLNQHVRVQCSLTAAQSIQGLRSVSPLKAWYVLTVAPQALARTQKAPASLLLFHLPPPPPPPPSTFLLLSLLSAPIVCISLTADIVCKSNKRGRGKVGTRARLCGRACFWRCNRCHQRHVVVHPSHFPSHFLSFHLTSHKQLRFGMAVGHAHARTHTHTHTHTQMSQ